MRLVFSWQCKYTYVYSGIGIVDQDVQPAILFTFDPLEQFFNFFVVCRITDNWQTVSTPLLHLCRQQTCQLWTTERNLSWNTASVILQRRKTSTSQLQCRPSHAPGMDGEEELPIVGAEDTYYKMMEPSFVVNNRLCCSLDVALIRNFTSAAVCFRVFSWRPVM